MRLIWHTILLKTRNLEKRTLHSGSELKKRESESVTRKEKTMTKIANANRMSWLNKSEKGLRKEE